MQAIKVLTRWGEREAEPIFLADYLALIKPMDFPEARGIRWLIILYTHFSDYMLAQALKQKKIKSGQYFIVVHKPTGRCLMKIFSDLETANELVEAIGKIVNWSYPYSAVMRGKEKEVLQLLCDWHSKGKLCCCHPKLSLDLFDSQAKIEIQEV